MSWENKIKFINILLLFKQSSENCVPFFTCMDKRKPDHETLLVLKFVRISEKFYNVKRFIFRPRPIHICQKRNQILAGFLKLILGLAIVQ
jgi:hypothetical protein